MEAHAKRLIIMVPLWFDWSPEVIEANDPLPDVPRTPEI
jgi:hypothetical protein